MSQPAVSAQPLLPKGCVVEGPSAPSKFEHLNALAMAGLESGRAVLVVTVDIWDYAAVFQRFGGSMGAPTPQRGPYSYHQGACRGAAPLRVLGLQYVESVLPLDWPIQGLAHTRLDGTHCLWDTQDNLVMVVDDLAQIAPRFPRLASAIAEVTRAGGTVVLGGLHEPAGQEALAALKLDIELQPWAALESRAQHHA